MGSRKIRHAYLLSLIMLTLLGITITYASPYRISNQNSTQNHDYYSTAECPGFLVNVSKSQLLNIVNATAQENLIGACALAALASYNSSGTLARYNISINLTEFNNKFNAGHPILNSSNSSLDTFPVNGSLLCVVRDFHINHQYKRNGRFPDMNKTRKMLCIISSININISNHTRSEDKTTWISSNVLTKDTYQNANITWYKNNTKSMDTGEKGKTTCHRIKLPNPNSNAWANTGHDEGKHCLPSGAKILMFNVTLPANTSSNLKMVLIPNLSSDTALIVFSNHKPEIINDTNSTVIKDIFGVNILSFDPNTGSTITIHNSTYYNWAGYIAYNNSNNAPFFSGIKGSWIVQPALSSLKSRQSSQWIGIGGANGVNLLSELIQTGTHSDYSDTGSRYYAWFEIYPLPPIIIPFFSINEGDKIVANMTLNQFEYTILHIQLWTIHISDSNTGSHYTILLPADANLSTAEWIDERPMERGTCNINQLNNNTCFYNLTNFINASFLYANATLGTNSKNTNLNILTSTRAIMANYPSPDNNAQPRLGFLSRYSGFNVINLRVGNLSVSNKTVLKGESYTIQPHTVADLTNPVQTNITGAVGGTGLYIYTWLESKPGSNIYTNATGCNYLDLILSGNTNCTVYTNSSTQTGTYKFKLEVRAAGGPSTEVITTEPINITVTPSNIPQTNSIPIRIINTQAQTASPFQQMLIINSASISGINSNWDNVEFTTAPNATGTVLQSWVESNASSASTHTLVWVKFPGGLPTGISTIYMDIMPYSTMSSNGPTGEAPQLSPAYGEYDNGNLVFNYYNNFASSTTGWTQSAGTTVDTLDGITITFNQNGYFVGPSEGTGTAFDAYVNSGGEEVNIGYINTGQPITYLGGTAWEATVIREACGNTYPDQIGQLEANACGLYYKSIIPGKESATGVFTIVPYSSTSSFQYINYNEGPSAPYQPVGIDAPAYPAQVGFAQMRTGNQTNAIGIQWARVRTAPPNGIMPNYQVDPFSVTNSTTSTTTTISITTSTTNSASTTTTTV